MSFRGRGRGRGGSRQYRSRDDETDKLSSSEESLRITVPNVPSDKPQGKLYDDDTPVDKDVMRDKVAVKKDTDKKPPVKERLGPPAENPDEESLRITVGNERFHDRPRDPPQARLGPPVNPKEKNSEKDKGSKNDKSRGSRSSSNHSERGNRRSYERDNRRANNKNNRSSERENRRSFERDDYPGRGRGGRRRSREHFEKDLRPGGVADRGRPSVGPERDRGWPDRVRDEFRQGGEYPRDRRPEFMEGGEMRRGYPDYPLHLQDPLGPLRDRSPLRDMRDPWVREPVELPPHLAMMGRPDMARPDLGIHDFSPGYVDPLREKPNDTPVDLGTALRSILKKRQAETVPSLPGAKVVDYGHGVQSESMKPEIPQIPEPRPRQPTLSEVLNILRPPTPEMPESDENPPQFEPQPSLQLPPRLHSPPQPLSQFRPQSILKPRPQENIAQPTHVVTPSTQIGGMEIDDEEQYLYGDLDEKLLQCDTISSLKNPYEVRPGSQEKNVSPEHLHDDPYGKWDRDADMTPGQVSLPNVVSNVSAQLPGKSLFPVMTSISQNEMPLDVPMSSQPPVSMSDTRESYQIASQPLSSETAKTEPATKQTITQAEAAKVAGDPTIQNILKSIGFNFELSKLMQEKAKKEREKAESKEELDTYGISAGSSFMGGGLKNLDLDSVLKAPTKETKKSKNIVSAETYEEKARRYREELAKAKARGQKSPIPFDEEKNDKDSSLNKPYEKYQERRQPSGDVDNDLRNTDFTTSRSKDYDNSRSSDYDNSRSRDYEPRSPFQEREQKDVNSDSKALDPELQNLFSSQDVDYRQPPSGYTYEQSSNPPQGYQQPYGGAQYGSEYPMFHDSNYSAAEYNMYGEPPAEAFQSFYAQDNSQGAHVPSNLTVISPVEEPAQRNESPEPERREIKILKDEISGSMRAVLPPKSESSQKRKHQHDRSRNSSSESSHSSYSPRRDRDRSRDRSYHKSSSKESSRSRYEGKTLSDKNRHSSSERLRTSSERSKSDRSKTSSLDRSKPLLSEKAKSQSSEKPKTNIPSDKAKTLSAEMKKKLLREREEREKRLQALERELDKLRRQQNEIMRKKQRAKDGHKDPLLLENTKLQDEISFQIKRLRKLADENSKMLSNASPGFKSTFEEKKEPDKKKASSSQNDRHLEKKEEKVEKKEEKSKEVEEEKTVRLVKMKDINKKAEEEKETKEVKPKGKTIRFEYFDPGNHWCRLCNHVSSNVYEVFAHLMSKKHTQKLDPYDHPWLKEMIKNKRATKYAGSAVAPFKGVEFMMAAQAFYCTMCKEFSGDMTCAEEHLKSESHNKKYQLYVDENPFYERRMQMDKAAGVTALAQEDDKRTLGDKKEGHEETPVDVKHPRVEPKVEPSKPQPEEPPQKIRRVENVQTVPERKTDIKREKEKVLTPQEKRNSEYYKKDRSKSSSDHGKGRHKEEKLKVMPMTRNTLFGRKKEKEKEVEEKEKTEFVPRISIKFEGKQQKSTKSNLLSMTEKDTPVSSKPAKKSAPFSLWKPKMDDYKELIEENVVANTLPGQGPVAKLDSFLSIGEEEAAVPVIPEKNPLKIDKETAEELKVLGIDVDSTATAMYSAQKPPSLAHSKPNTSSSMASTNATKMYNVYYSDPALKQKAQDAASKFTTQAVVDSLTKSKWDNPENNDDAKSETSDVSVDMGDFEILDECHDS